MLPLCGLLQGWESPGGRGLLFGVSRTLRRAAAAGSAGSRAQGALTPPCDVACGEASLARAWGPAAHAARSAGSSEASPVALGALGLLSAALAAHPRAITSVCLALPGSGRRSA